MVKCEAGLEPASTKTKTVQWTVFTTRPVAIPITGSKQTRKTYSSKDFEFFVFCKFDSQMDFDSLLTVFCTENTENIENTEDTESVDWL